MAYDEKEVQQKRQRNTGTHQYDDSSQWWLCRRYHRRRFMRGPWSPFAMQLTGSAPVVTDTNTSTQCTYPEGMTRLSGHEWSG